MPADPRHALTLVLAALTVVAAVLVALELAGLGRGYRLPDPSPASPLPQIAVDAGLARLPPLDAFTASVERPLFEPDRRPPPPAIVEGGTPTPEPRPETPPLEVRVTGIVVTPEVRLVMVRPAGAPDSVVLREGMPLPGDFAGWKVARVLPRRVEFEGGGQLRSTVELEVDKSVREPSPATGEAFQPAASNPDLEVQRRAEEIRRRIEERRRQLREEAARLGGPEKQ
jgi:general secretion pathway protein N